MQRNVCTMYIVRHGEAELNLKGQYGTVPESPLTSKGKEQAKSLAKELSSVPFEAVFSSNFVRAKQTAEAFALERNLAITAKEILRERSYGRFNGKTEKQMKEELKEIYDQYEKMPNKDKYYYKLVDDMETVEEAMQRFIPALREIAMAYRNKTVLVVSHVTLMRGLLIHLGYVNHHEIDSRCIDKTAYIKLQSDGVNFFVLETKGVRKRMY